MGVGAVAAAAGGSLLGNLLNGAMNNIYEWQNRGWKSQAEYEDYRADYDKAISDYFLQRQMDYNTEMSSSAYQRAVADMEAAGINPASLGGSAPSAASPTASGVSHSGAATNARMNLSPFGSSESVFKSLLDSCLTNSREAQRIAGRELIDNARHDHKMEEIREATAQYDAKNKLYNEKGEYYKELTKKLQGSKSNGTGSKYLDSLKKNL